MMLLSKTSKLGFVCIALQFTVPSASQAQIADLSCYRMPGGQLDYNAIERDDRQKTLRTNCQAQRASIAQSAHAAVMAVPPKKSFGKTDAAAQPARTTPLSVNFLLRKDLADVGLFTEVTDNSKATGASISWTRDGVAKDSIWAVDGLAALAVTYAPGLDSYDYPSSFIGVTVAPYVKLNKQFHTKASVKDTDINTYGGSGEIGFKNPGGGANYFRGHWSLTDDNVASSQIGQTGLEWIPTYLRINRQVFDTPFAMTFRPELVVQYDNVTAGVAPVPFSGRRESLRVGPQAALWLGYSFPTGMEPPGLAAILAQLYATVTYHWWEETYSGRSGNWLETAVNFNLDKDGNVALSGSYKKGMDEQSGKDSNLFKVELKVKTCTDLTSMGQCRSSSD